jgi:hypothetical protein
MTGFCTRIAPAFRHGRIIVPLTGGICLLLLVMVLKNILLVPAAELSSQMILYIICYMGFIVSYSVAETRAPASPMRTLLWMGTCILMTIGIIAVYAM